jgi:WD40 repeat protein
MTVTIGELASALHAQALELSSPTLTGRRYAVAQQLLYQTCLEPTATELRSVAAARLERLVRAVGTPGLATRWTSSKSPRRRLVSGCGGITALAVALDGSFVVFGAAEGIVWRWRFDDWTRPERLGQLSHQVSVVAMGTDGQSFVTGDYSGAVVAWDLSKGQPTTYVLGRHADYVRAVVIDRNSGAIYSSSDDGLIARWHDGERIEVARLARACSALAIEQPGGELYSGDRAGEIWRWDPVGGAEGKLLGCHQPGPVTALTVIPGPTVISTAWDGVLHAWQWPGSKYRHRVLGRHSAPLTGGIVSDSGRLLTATKDGLVLIWRYDESKQKPAVLGMHDLSVSAVGAEAGVVVTGGRDGFLIRWDEADQRLPSPEGSQRIPVRAIAATPDRSVVFTGGDAGIHLWRLGDEPAPPQPEHLWHVPVRALVLVGAKHLITCDEYDRLLAWDLAATWTEPRVLRRGAGNESFWHLAAIPGGDAVLTSMGAGDLLRWSLHEADQPELVGSHLAEALAVAPDGTWAVTGGDDTELLRWDLDRPGEATWLGKVGARIRALTITPDGRWVLTGDDRGRIMSWDATATHIRAAVIGSLVQNPGGQPRGATIRSITVADDSSWVASVTDEGTIECWNTADGSVTSLLPIALPNLVIALGDRLLAADHRGGLTLFDVILPSAVASEPGPPPEVVLIVDRIWCNQVRSGRLMDVATLREDLCGNRVSEALLPCPDLPALTRFRNHLRANGWTVPTVELDGTIERDLIIKLATAAAAAPCDVVLVSGNPQIRAALAAVPEHERIAVVDDIERWMLEP